MVFPSALSAKRLGKRIIGYPEETVPVISSTNWLAWFYKNPLQDVSRKFNLLYILIRPFQIKAYLLSLFPILTWITRYSQLIYRELELELR
jgi:sodium-independent sulfate anion transporter 11